jgi:hypothetical protein
MSVEVGAEVGAGSTAAGVDGTSVEVGTEVGAGSTGAGVGGTRVDVGEGLAPQPLVAKARNVARISNTVRFFILLLLFHSS